MTHLGYKAHVGLKMLRSTKIISASWEHFFVNLTVFVVLGKSLFLTIFLNICSILLVFSHIFNMSNLIALSEEDFNAFGINLVDSVSHAKLQLTDGDYNISQVQHNCRQIKVHIKLSFTHSLNVQHILQCLFVLP